MLHSVAGARVSPPRHSSAKNPGALLPCHSRALLHTAEMSVEERRFSANASPLQEK